MNAVRADADGVGRRVLAAVAFADVVNYSAMMAADEAGTHLRWMAVLDQVLRPKASLHDGTVVKSTGDGILARFGSALDAVEWAEAVQRELDLPGGTRDRRIVLRMSVHLGDIITTADDIFGDGVNVAARLLEHAAPGGIVLSEAVHDLVRGSVGSRAVDMGLRQLKSFERPVRIYHVAPQHPGAVRCVTPVGSVPSVAVLPLANHSDDARDAYFADGVVEDIIASLAGLGDLLVISSGSTLSLRNLAMDPREAGHRLGVRYVLVGSLRRSADLIRLRLRLCDASDGSTTWTYNADLTPGELFGVQDMVVAKVVAGIAPNVRLAELRRAMRKRPESFSAYDHLLRGIHSFHSPDKDDFRKAKECFDLAIEEDAFFATGFAWNANWHTMNVGNGLSTDIEGDISSAGALAGRAIELDAGNATALAIYGHVKSYFFHQWELGQLYLERALEACPNSQLAQIFYAATLSYIGEGARAVRHAEHGLRLSPCDRTIYQTHTVLCLAHYASGGYVEAMRWGRMALAGNRAYTASHRLLMASLVAVGRLDEAHALAADMVAVEPGFSVRTYARTRQPFAVRSDADTFTDRLRTAGLPE